jgi:Tfp pilus assembly protein FimT
MDKRNGGFSVTELLIVVGITGILVGAAAAKISTGPDEAAYRSATRVVIALARATSLAAWANATHNSYLLIDTTSASDRFVRGWVDLNDNGAYDGEPTDILIGEYHLIKGSFMNISTTVPGPATVTWQFLPVGTATTGGGAGTLIFCSSVSKTNPAAGYTTGTASKWTTITLVTASNRTRECYQAVGCP